MALVKCGECGEQVSDQAKACPKCGAPPAKAKPAGVPLWLMLAVAGGAVWFFMVVMPSGGGGSSNPSPALAAQQEPGGLTIPSDPSATFYVLETSGPPTARIIVTKRVGGDGVVSFSKRQYDCKAVRVKYIGSGSTIPAMNASKPDEKMSGIVPESIASYVGGIACK